MGNEVKQCVPFGQALARVPISGDRVNPNAVRVCEKPQQESVFAETDAAKKVQRPVAGLIFEKTTDKNGAKHINPDIVVDENILRARIEKEVNAEMQAGNAFYNGVGGAFSAGEGTDFTPREFDPVAFKARVDSRVASIKAQFAAMERNMEKALAKNHNADKNDDNANIEALEKALLNGETELNVTFDINSEGNATFNRSLSSVNPTEEAAAKYRAGADDLIKSAGMVSVNEDSQTSRVVQGNPRPELRLAGRQEEPAITAAERAKAKELQATEDPRSLHKYTEQQAAKYPQLENAGLSAAQKAKLTGRLERLQVSRVDQISIDPKTPDGKVFANITATRKDGSQIIMRMNITE